MKRFLRDKTGIKSIFKWWDKNITEKIPKMDTANDDQNLVTCRSCGSIGPFRTHTFFSQN